MTRAGDIHRAQLLLASSLVVDWQHQLRPLLHPGNQVLGSRLKEGVSLLNPGAAHFVQWLSHEL